MTGRRTHVALRAWPRISPPIVGLTCTKCLRYALSRSRVASSRTVMTSRRSWAKAPTARSADASARSLALRELSNLSRKSQLMILKGSRDSRAKLISLSRWTIKILLSSMKFMRMKSTFTLSWISSREESYSTKSLKGLSFPRTMQLRLCSRYFLR
jgi:hypothetical protein